MFDFEEILSKYRVSEIKPYFMNDDGSLLIMLVRPSGAANDVIFSKKMLKQVSALITKYKSDQNYSAVRINSSGVYQVVVTDNKDILHDLFRLSLLAFFIILLIIIYYFRTLKAVVLILAPIIFSITLNFAVTYLLIGYLNMLSGFLTGILMGLGLAFSIHVLSRYIDNKRHEHWWKALVRSVVRTGRAAFAGSLTTAVAFYSLMFSGFKGFFEFGLIAGNGMLMTIISMFTVFPCLIILFEKYSHIRLFKIPVIKNHTFLVPTFGFYRFYERKRNIIKILSVILLVVSLVSLRKVRFEYDFTKIRGRAIASSKMMRSMEGVLAMSLNPTVIMVEGFLNVQAVVSAIKSNAQTGVFKTVKQVNSLSDFVPGMQKEKKAVIKRLKKIYNEYSEIIEAIPEAKPFLKYKQSFHPQSISPDDVPSEIYREFVAKDDSTYLITVWPNVSVYDGAQLKMHIDELNTLKKDFKDIKISGSYFIFSEILDLILTEGVRVLYITMILLAIVTAFIFKNVKDVVVILMSLLCGIAVMLGVMGLTGVTFNYINVIVLPIALGMGIDSSIHIIYRLKEKRKRNLPAVMSTVSRVIFVSQVTTAIGFTVLIGAVFKGLQTLGYATVIGVLATLLVSLYVLPSFLYKIYKIKPKHTSRQKH
jgi:predicted RND superfamily exporter protein